MAWLMYQIISKAKRNNVNKRNGVIINVNISIIIIISAMSICNINTINEMAYQWRNVLMA
jgi:hypothetical protein